MDRSKRLPGIALVVLTLTWRMTNACQAETLISTDFSKGCAGWALNGDAKLQTIEGKQLLSLTQNENNQTGVAWTELKRKVPSFSFIADLRIRFHPMVPDDCPADGATLAFAPGAAGADIPPTSGGNLGLYGGPLDTFVAFEINTWHLQGLGTEQEMNDCRSGKHVTFAFDVINPEVPYSGRTEGQSGTPEKGGAKIGQVLPPHGMTIVNGGWYRYQWNVDGATNTMSVYVTGLEERNKQFQRTKVLEVKFLKNPIDFAGRFGLTAATGGAMEHTEIAAVRVDSPMIAPLEGALTEPGPAAPTGAGRPAARTPAKG